jgi:hypothetical protein
VEATKSEVKGIWLVSARDYIVRDHGPDALARIALHLEPELRATLTDPLPSAWYPEQSLAQSLAGMNVVLARGSETRFCEIIAACTTFGVGRFFRVMLRASSARFVMRQVPAMWQHVRRGAGRVAVRDTGRGSLIAYRDFPYFDDPNYRNLTLGSLTALLEICSGRRPNIAIRRFDTSSLDVEVVHE